MPTTKYLPTPRPHAERKVFGTSAPPGNRDALRIGHDWHARVALDLIPNNPGTTNTQLARHVRNELMVLGRVR